MSQSDGIAWTDATWNPVGGCSVHSPGCKNCYAMKLAGTRLRHHPLYAGTTDPSKAGPVFNGHLTIAAPAASVWDWPRKWAGSRTPRLGLDADGDPRPSLIFVGDMSDLFHENRPAADVARVIVACAGAVRAGRRHIFQLLTKRPDVMRRFFGIASAGGQESGWPMPDHLWLGFSAERQEEFDERWPHMLELSRLGFTIFVSYEPALGPLVLPADFLALGRRAWVILGGESGRRARRANVLWFRDVLSQCQHAGVPAFMKQLGAEPDWSSVEPLAARLASAILVEDSKGADPTEWPLDLRVRQFPGYA